MPKLNEIIYNIKNLKGGGLYSDDTDLSDAQILFILDYYREKLIDQDFNKGRRNLDGLDQALNKVKVNDDVSAFPTLDKDFYITDPFPSFISLRNGLAIRQVGQGENQYEYIQQGRSSLIKYNRYTKDEGYYFPLEDRLVLITSTISVNRIPIIGIFKHPIKVLEFNSGSPIYDYDIEYPITGRMLEMFYKMIINGEINFSLSIPDDKTNNTKDDQTIEAK